MYGTDDAIQYKKSALTNMYGEVDKGTSLGGVDRKTQENVWRLRASIRWKWSTESALLFERGAGVRDVVFPLTEIPEWQCRVFALYTTSALRHIHIHTEEVLSRGRTHQCWEIMASNCRWQRFSCVNRGGGRGAETAVRFGASLGGEGASEPLSYRS